MLQSIHHSDIFYGWGRKKSGLNAVKLSKRYHSKPILLEDGFIRSIGLGDEGSQSFSLIEDDIGIYYDANTPSKLENILNTYDFESDTTLINTANEAKEAMLKHHISKYNYAPDFNPLALKDTTKKRILVIAQTKNDASLKYGLANHYTTQEMILDALKENPDATVYLKIHPDVLSGKKESDISIDTIPSGCFVLKEDVNPLSLLKHFDKIYTKTSGMGMEALLLGLEVICYGLPYYAGWGLTIDKQSSPRRQRKLNINALFAGAYILYTRYYNPYTQKESSILDTIYTIAKYRNITLQHNKSMYFFGFSRWKRKYIIPFFPFSKKSSMYFCTTLDEALNKGLDTNSSIYIWGKKSFNTIESHAESHFIHIVRVEDGFVRSVSLGSDLTKAYSIVVDTQGIYFNPHSKSDLETLLNTYHFDDTLLKRAEALKRYLIKNKISKYNIHQDKKIILKDFKESQKIILVPGQVEDDASIKYGANSMTNLMLLKEARENAKDAYIIYKPHPDVFVGNRKGKVSNTDALKYCDTIITDVSLDSVLALADEVHTMTSLVGFEALIRGKTVYTYGLPFYAGWGLTTDSRVSKNRIIQRTLHELIAATLILYPRYINPKNNNLCEVEVLLDILEKEKIKYHSSTYYSSYIKSRNFFSRKIQLLLKVVLP